MASRRRGGGSRGPNNPHDRKVKQVADAAKRRGNKNVRAHLPGQSAPPKLGGRIPDVTWTRSDGARVVREIDPPGRASLRDKAQDRAMRNAAKRSGVDYRRLKYPKK